jgi:hypothetical protein
MGSMEQYLHLVSEYFKIYFFTKLAFLITQKGQTGTGKSFTMFGPDFDKDLKGIIPRSCM